MTSKQRNKEKAVATILTASMLMTMGSPAFAEELPAVEEQIVTSGIVEVASQPGGEVEEVDVIMSTQQNPDGTIEIKAETAVDGDVTDSGLNVVYNAEKTLDETENVIKEDSEYKAKNAEGTYEAEGGTETNTETVMPTEDDDVEIDVLENGEATNDTVTGGETNSETTPTNEGDKTKAEDSANFDQTTTTTTEREVEVNDIKVDVTNGDLLFVDADGNPLYRDNAGNPIYIDPDTGDYVDTQGNKVDYTPSNGTSWQYIDFQQPDNEKGWAWGWGYYGKSNYYVVDKDGNETRLWNGADDGLALRYVKNADGDIIGGLYCLDVHTGNINGVDYRLVNLEDAAMEGYYTEEEAEHLRFIMENGYYTNVPNDEGQCEANLNAMKARLQEARKAGLLDLDEASIEALTYGQAVSATGMAVWQYGNRNTLEDVDPSKGETFLIKHSLGDETVQKIYEYLIQGTTPLKTEEQIINQERFIDDMELVVGTMVQGDAANMDDDNTNDKYNVGLKFSLQVVPDKTSDDLIVKVMDSAGNVVQSARIAGENKDGEQFDYAKEEVDENGKIYYVLEGMQLSENSNTKFNLKLEGTQLLEEGVYVFTADKPLSEAIQETYDYWTTDEHWSDEQKWAYGELKDELGLTDINQMTKEMYKENLPKLYGYDSDMVRASQNLIGKFAATAEVDTSMTVDLTFNVEEATVSVTHEWRSESDPSGGGGDSYTPPTNPPTPPTTEPDIPDTLITDEPTPLAETPEVDIEEPGVPLGDAPEEEMFDDPVPLGDAPATGDNTNTMGYVGMMLAALAGLVVTRKRVN